MASGSSFSRYSTIVPEAIEGGEDAGNGGGEIELKAAPSSTSGGSDPFADAAAIAEQRDAEDAEFFNSIKNMDDLVSKTNLQWALRESGEIASAVAGDAAGSASGGAQKRPKARPRPAPSKESEPGRTSGDGAEMLKVLKNAPVSNPEPSPAPDPAKAPLALAQAHLIAMRAKYKVVEALLEDEAESVPQLHSIVGADMSGEDFCKCARSERWPAGAVGRSARRRYVPKNPFHPLRGARLSRGGSIGSTPRTARCT